MYYKRLVPPNTWENHQEHWFRAMREPWYINMLRIQDVAVASAHEFLRNSGLLHMIAPMTTGSISSPMGAGSDSLPVAIELNNKKTYLADSMQFALEYGFRLAPKGVYYIMQCFRGEEPDATHLSQFCHIEFEISGDLDETMNLSWKLIQKLCMSLAKNCRDEITSAVGSVDHLHNIVNLVEPPQIKFSEAIKEVDQSGYCILENDVRILTKSGEKQISEKYSVANTLWVTHMDSLSVPFYQAVSEFNPKESITADLLIGGREVVGSGHRHTDGESVRKALQRHSVNEKDYEWYVRMKDELPMSTSGMGLGLERFLMWVVGCDDIRNIPIISRLTTELSVP